MTSDCGEVNCGIQYSACVLKMMHKTLVGKCNASSKCTPLCLYCSWLKVSFLSVVLKRIVIFAIWIVASLTIEYRIIGVHTHTQSSSGRWHTQLAANLLFANRLKVFPYRTPQRPRFTWARHTIRSRHMEHHVRANYVITRISVYVLWHSNDTVMIEYLNIVLFVSALLFSN